MDINIEHGPDSKSTKIRFASFRNCGKDGKYIDTWTLVVADNGTTMRFVLGKEHLGDLENVVRRMSEEFAK